jgi:hypothetical protein
VYRIAQKWLVLPQKERKGTFSYRVFSNYSLTVPDSIVR